MGSNALGLVLRRGKSNSPVRVKESGPAERVSQAGRTIDSTMQFFWRSHSTMLRIETRTEKSECS